MPGVLSRAWWCPLRLDWWRQLTRPWHDTSSVVDSYGVWALGLRVLSRASLDCVKLIRLGFETPEAQARSGREKLRSSTRSIAFADVERRLQLARSMNLSHPALGELERIVDQCNAVRRYLETDCVDVSLVTRAERNLYDEALAVIATLARTAEQTVAFEELTRRADELKLGGNREQRLKRRCLELLGMVCDGDLDLEVFSWLTLMALADLGRVVWALRLTDRMLQRKGPAWAWEMVERVKKQAMGKHQVASGSAAIDDRTVQLGSKLALERVMFSASCQEELKSTVELLLDTVKTNIERIDAPTQARPVPRSRRQANVVPLREQLMRVAHSREDSHGPVVTHECG